jgi:hypothetical protein
MKEDILAQIIYEDENHIHRVEGFFVDGVEYKITDVDKRKGGGGEVYINMNFGEELNSLIKSFYLFGERDRETQKFTHYLSITSSRPPVQQGGALFPVPAPPKGCDRLVYNIPRLVISYSEPTISYVKLLGATNYREFVDRHMSHGNASYDYLLDMLDETTFPDYEEILMRYHFIGNKFAHNGIEIELDDISSKIRTPVPDREKLHFIHSICHLYDALYMYDMKSPKYVATADILSKYEKLFASSDDAACFVNMINKNAGDFLQGAGEGKYNYPYSYIYAASEAKRRQYGRDAPDTYFFEQIVSGSTRPRRYITRGLPNTILHL